jgi:hypothetical protein
LSRRAIGVAFDGYLIGAIKQKRRGKIPRR